MHCNKCGLELPDGSLFCNKCGAVQEDGQGAQAAEAHASAHENRSVPEPPHKKKKSGKIALSILLIVALLAGSWYLFFADGGAHNPLQKVDPDVAALQEALGHIGDTDDDDSDGLNNYFEEQFKTDKANPDTDSDGLSDYIEVAVLKTDPLKADTDGNGISDADEDLDEDTLTNIDEAASGLNPAMADSDFDGLNDGDELNLHKTKPSEADTDGDLASDGWEVAKGFDPLKANKSFDVKQTAKTDDGKASASVRVKLSPEQAETLHISEVTGHYYLNEDMPGYIAPAYDFSVYGDFGKANISFKVDKSLLASGAKPTIYWFNPDTQKLEEQDTAVSGGTAKATVSHFSVYILADKNVYTDSFEAKKIADTDGDGYPDNDNPYDNYTGKIDPHPFVWDISDRDLLICAGVSYTDINYWKNLSTMGNERASEQLYDCDSQFYQDLDNKLISTSELHGWDILKRKNDQGSGFSATVFLKNDNVIVAFRGTNEFKDWRKANLPALLGIGNEQTKMAESLIEEVSREYKGKNIYITGHSLGGYLSYVAATRAYGLSLNIMEVATFNALGLNVQPESNRIDVLRKHEENIFSYGVKGDLVFGLENSYIKVGTQYCDKDYFDDGIISAHCIYNFIDDVEPFDRLEHQAEWQAEITDASGPSSDEPAASPPTRQVYDNAIQIVDVSPASVNASSPTQFTVTVKYTSANAGDYVIYAGANTESESEVTLYDEYVPDDDSGEYTFSFTCTPRKWDGYNFGIYVGIAENTDTSNIEPLDEDTVALTITGSNDYSGDFVIEGKWKQVGEKTFGQAQEGAIIVFDGTHCNFYSPQDTYAFYKNGGKYQLDITSLLFAENFSFKVEIIDENNISIRGVLLKRVS
jgi:hypothetical protein